MRGRDWAERMGRLANPKRSTPGDAVDTTAVMALIDSYAWDEASKPAPVTATPPLSVTSAAVEAAPVSVAVTEPVPVRQDPASDPPVVEPLVAPTLVTEPAPVPVPVADTTREHEPQVPVVASPMVEVPTMYQRVAESTLLQEAYQALDDLKVLAPPDKGRGIGLPPAVGEMPIRHPRLGRGPSQGPGGILLRGRAVRRRGRRANNDAPILGWLAEPPPRLPAVVRPMPAGWGAIPTPTHPRGATSTDRGPWVVTPTPEAKRWGTWISG
jgi:hypothetical protein